MSTYECSEAGECEDLNEKIIAIERELNMAKRAYADLYDMFQTDVPEVHLSYDPIDERCPKSLIRYICRQRGK